jgi:transposase
MPERFGNWNTIYRNFDRWAKDGVWAQVLEHVQGLAETRGEIHWMASIDSTIARVHQHGATWPRAKKGACRITTKRATSRPIMRSGGRAAG